MFKMIKTICALIGVVVLCGTGAFAQQDPPTFPTFSADDPQRIGIVSKLTPERRVTLAHFLDEADTYGFFPPKLEARGSDEFGIVLYVLSSWEEAQKLPPEILPPLAAQQLKGINPNFFRYSIPVRRKAEDTFVLMFYIAGQPNDKTLQCLAQDLVLTLSSGFDPKAVAPCVRKAS